VTVEDTLPIILDIFPDCLKNENIKKETYVMDRPKMHVGNLLFGERYIEPSGSTEIRNENTGESCTLDYLSREGWISVNTDNVDKVKGIIKDK